MSRKTLLTSIERINTDIAKRRKQADADYLRALASLQTKAAANPELAKQVAAEKTALLAGGGSASGSGGAAAKVARGKNVVVNGDFEKIDADGKPEGWNGIRNVTVEDESGNRFVRFIEGVLTRDGKTELQALSQMVEVPPKVKTVRIRARIRARIPAGFKQDTGKKPRVYLEFKDSTGKPLSWIHGVWNGGEGKWIEAEAEKSIPQNAVRVAIMVTNDHCPGQIDFDDIEVTFK